MKIADFIREELILPEIRSTKKADVIRELASHLAAHETDVGTDELIRVLNERERLGSTAIGEAIAIPHGKLDAVHRLVGCFGRSRKGIDFASEDGQPTHFFFVLVAPSNSTGEHLKALARISRLFKNPDVRGRLMAAATAHELYGVIEQEDAAAAR